jgi:hypothetical protein
MIAKKTAVLLACSLKLGAIAAGAKEVDAEHLYQFGLHLGISFQLKDDILDCCFFNLLLMNESIKENDVKELICKNELTDLKFFCKNKTKGCKEIVSYD